MSARNIPSSEDIDEVRAATAYRNQGGAPDLSDCGSWVHHVMAQPDGGLVEVIDALAAARARITALEHTAALAAACRPPEVHERPSDAELVGLVKALAGTGDPLYVLGEELLEQRRVTQHATERAVGAESKLDEARVELQQLHNDTQQHYAAIAAKQKRYARDHDLYRGALRDAARMLSDLGVTNLPPRFTEALALEEIPR